MGMQLAQVLIVDDDDVDAKAIARGLRRRGVDFVLQRAVDGEEALHMLRGTGGYDPVEGPVIVTLDLNMPRMNGFECLEALRSDPELAHTIVFVVSTSDTDDDKREAYRLHPAGYVVKGTDPAIYEGIADLLAKYNEVVSLP